MKKKPLPLHVILAGLLICFTFSATSCSDDDDNEKGGVPKKLLLTELITEEDVVTIEYDNSNRPVKFTWTETEEERETKTYTLTYDEDSKLISDGIFDFEYKKITY